MKKVGIIFGQIIGLDWGPGRFYIHWTKVFVMREAINREVLYRCHGRPR
jgi:hypothetical protein